MSTGDRDLVTEQELKKKRNLRGLAQRRVRGNGPPFVKVGHRVYYDLKVVDDWLSKNTFSSTAEYAA